MLDGCAFDVAQVGSLRKTSATRKTRRLMESGSKSSKIQTMLEARHPVAIFSMGLGDHLMVLPALRALAGLFDGRLSLICKPGGRNDFFRQLPLNKVHEIHMQYVFEGKSVRYSEDGSKLEPTRIRFDAEWLANEVSECDLFVSFNSWHSSSVDDLIERLAPANTIGYFPQFGIRLPIKGHGFDAAFAIPQYLNPALKIEDVAGAPEVLPDIHRWAREWRAGLPSSIRVLAVHNESKPRKLWPTDRLVNVLDQFLGRHPNVIALVLGLSDVGLTKGRYGHRIIPCFGKPLHCAISLIGESDLFLGIDSSMLHAADLFRVPGVGLFGPSDPSEYGFRFGPHRHIRGADNRMDTITEDEVLIALESLLTEHATADKGASA